jgi:hypothetical protein
MTIFVIQNVYFVIQLTWVRAKSEEVRVTEWINFAFCMVVNYYQLVTLVEINQNVLIFSGWAINIISCLFIGITFGYPSLVYLKKLVVYFKRTHFNVKNRTED